ncbi:hypothetical protein V1512DRAFT_248169 [Lipomyces arxii]|uniref:uncharacterized protein n=1 Tax=Lipomyces arxii TaxID=56418 RepID=UPI0034D00EAC
MNSNYSNLLATPTRLVLPSQPLSYYDYSSSPTTPVTPMDSFCDDFQNDLHYLNPIDNLYSSPVPLQSLTSAPTSNSFCDPKSIEIMTPRYCQDLSEPRTLPGSAYLDVFDPMGQITASYIASGSSDCTDSEEEFFETMSLTSDMLLSTVFPYEPPFSSSMASWSAPISPVPDESPKQEIITTRVQRRGRKPSLIEDPTKIFVCIHCNRRFRRHEHLKRHFRSLHTREKPFKCGECSKSFSRSDNLAQHVRTHVRGEEGDDFDETADDQSLNYFNDSDTSDTSIFPGSGRRLRTSTSAARCQQQRVTK